MTLEIMSPPEGVPATAWFDNMAYWYDDPSTTKYHIAGGEVDSVEPYDEYDLANLARRQDEIERNRPIYDSLAANEAIVTDNGAWLAANPDADPMLRSLAEQNIQQAEALNRLNQPVVDQVVNSTHLSF